MRKKKPKKLSKPKEISRKSNTLKILFLVFVFAVTSAVLLALFKAEQPVEYKDLKTVNSSDQRLYIDVPAQLSAVESGIGIIDYEHRSSSQDGRINSHVRVDSQYLGEDSILKSKINIIGQLTSKKGEYYELFKNKSKTSSNAQNLVFSDFKNYSSQNINEAIVSDFSYKYDEVNVVGRLLITFDDDTLYFLIAEATEDAWLKNLSVWNSVFTSFKIE